MFILLRLGREEEVGPKIIFIYLFIIFLFLDEAN